MEKDVRVKIKRKARETGQLPYNPLRSAELFFPCMSHKTRHIHICKYPPGGRILSLLQNVRIGSWTHQSLFHWCQSLCTRQKAAGAWSCPFTYPLAPTWKQQWRSASTPTYLHGVQSYSLALQIYCASFW